MDHILNSMIMCLKNENVKIKRGTAKELLKISKSYNNYHLMDSIDDLIDALYDEDIEFRNDIARTLAFIGIPVMSRMQEKFSDVMIGNVCKKIYSFIESHID